MPKVSRNRTIYARREPTGLLERITISDPHWFDSVGKPRWVNNPAHKPIIHRLYDPKLAQQSQDNINRLLLLACLTHKQRLLDQILELAPPLIERIAPAYEAPQPLPDVHFHKTKIIKQTKDFTTMFEATATRLEPLMQKVQAFEEEEGGTIPEQKQLSQMLDGLDTLYYKLEAKAPKLSNKHWRSIKRDLKCIGKVSFHDLSTRYKEIVSELVALHITFKYKD